MLRMGEAIYRAIRSHAEEAYPDECCGALLGIADAQGWLVRSSIRAANASLGSTATRYEIAPAELVRILREARTLGLEIAGFYHSHPDHPAQWSETDLAQAHWLGCCYVITSVEAGRASQTNSFLLAGRREEEKYFEPERIDIGDG